MRKERVSIGMILNLVLLLAMAAANILSFYHLSSSSRLSYNPPLHQDPITVDPLLRQLHSIRASIATLQSSSSSSSKSSSTAPPELLLYAKLSPIASACSDHPHLLHSYMNYTPFSRCPISTSAITEALILRGCHPLPRRRCFSASHTTPLPYVKDLVSKSRTNQNLFSSKSALDLTIPQLLTIFRAAPGAGTLKLGLDIGGGAGFLAEKLKALIGATILTTTMNLGSPFNEAAALRGVVPMHVPLQQRFLVPDGSMDLVRTGHAVNRWIPETVLEFMVMDVDRVLRAGGMFWVDHYFCRGSDLEKGIARVLGRLGYKRIKWAVGNKTDGNGVKFGEVYLTALLQKPDSAKV